MLGYLRKVIFLFFWIIIGPQEIHAQGFQSDVLQVRPANNAAQLILNDFIKQDGCLEVSNVKAIGDPSGVGSFSNGRESISIDEGIVFTTGNVGDVSGPNVTGSASGMGNGLSEAPFLRRATQSSRIFDLVGVEFDFVPTNSFIGFSYVFASEEYCEFVGSRFNDAFGFFVSGPGIFGDGHRNSINVAKIPESEEVVSINNVNYKKNANYYIDNLTPFDENNCGIESESKNITNIEFDGYTVRLQAFLEVIPCETYTIRLVVADVSDDALDSAVFLESKSFSSIGLASVEAEVFGSDELVLFENCLEGQFTFAKNSLLSIRDDIQVNYRVGGSATLGVDYEFIPENITIPGNSFTESLPIVVLPDTEDEPRESIEIIIEAITCDCISRDTAVLYIEDRKDQIDVIFDDVSVCMGQEFTFGPIVDGGAEPLDFSWSTGDATETISDNITQNREYRVTVSDFCGAIDSAEINIGLRNPPELDVTGSVRWCEGLQNQDFLLDLSGIGPWSLSFSIDGEDPIRLDDIMANPYPIPFLKEGNYQFLEFEDQYCVGEVNGSVLVEKIEFSMNINGVDPTCINSYDGSATIDINGGTTPYFVNWGVEEGSGTELINLAGGTYYVTVQDEIGCTLKDSVILLEADPNTKCEVDLEKDLYIPTIFSPNGDDTNDLFTIYPNMGVIVSASYSIYDRWGNLIFESAEINSNESVTFWNGKNYRPGVYSCMVKLELIDGTIEYIGQDVTLIK